MRLSRLSVLLIAPLVMAAAHAPGNTFKQDLSWKRYSDPQSGFCLQYPKRWMRQDMAEGDGVAFSTGVKRYSMPTGEMDVTVLTAPDDSTELLQAHLDGMKRFVRAERIQILDRRKVTIDGNAAMLTKDQYRDALEKADWTEEIIVAKREDKLYRLEMVCRSDQVARFEQVFGHLVDSFAFGCHRK